MPTPCGASWHDWKPLIGSCSSSGEPYLVLRLESGPHSLLYLHDPHHHLTLLHVFPTPYARSAYEYALLQGTAERWPDFILR
jgi:hypothetical protein